MRVLVAVPRPAAQANADLPPEERRQSKRRDPFCQLAQDSQSRPSRLAHLQAPADMVADVHQERRLLREPITRCR